MILWGLALLAIREFCAQIAKMVFQELEIGNAQDAQPKEQTL